MTDRPWGVTLGAIALRRHTGQLTVESDGKRYCIAFDDGTIVAASSPMAADAIARVALTSHFITSTQVPDLMRRLASSPDRDEVDVLAETIRFTPAQVHKLRQRMVAQRAARTFSLERGDFMLDDRITLRVFDGVGVDHRHVIYLGVRTNLSEQRLIADLRQLGSFFVLKPEAIDELPRYGFDATAEPVIEALKVGTSLPELEAQHREIDPRSAQAIIYALVSCTACVIPPRTPTAALRESRTPTGTRKPAGSRTTTPREPARSRTATQRDPEPPRTSTPRGTQVSRTDSEPRNPATARTSTRTGPQEPDANDTSPNLGTQLPFAGGTATFHNQAPVHGTSPTLPPSVGRSATPPSGGRTTTSPSVGRSATPPSGGRTTTPPSGGRTTTSPFASRTSTKSPTAYSGSGDSSAGTNTPAAMRSRASSEPGIPREGRATTPPTTPAAPRTPTQPSTGRAPTRSAASLEPPVRAAGTRTTHPARPTASAVSAPPPTTARAETEEGVGFVETPTPPPLPTAPKPRPTLSRVLTPSDAETRGFIDQRTPGFGDQRTLADQRTPTEPSQARTPTDPAQSRTPTGSPATSRVSTDNAAAAESSFKRGEAAMKRDQPGEAILEFKAACDLNPGDVDYAAMLAWAKFCAAGDKPAIGAETRKLLERAVFKSHRPERARFYLGRVERMLGRDKEALRHFQEVLDLKPNHADAASEIRAIEARQAAASKSGGLFGRKR